MSAVEALSPGYRTQLEPLAISGRKGGQSNQTTPAESPDSLRSISKAKILLAISEGEIQGELTGKDIYLDKTPLIDANGNENFPGVKWDYRPGTVHQSYIPGIAAVENEVAVGVELTSAVPYTRLITNSQLSAVRVRFRWPALQQQLSNGDITGYRIAYAIDVATDGGAYETLLNGAVDGKTTQAYERSHRITLPTGSSWQIRIRRLTANANNNQVADAMFITAITDIVDRKFRHPNTALLYVEFDASQFQNIPQVACEPKGRIVRVPVNYDPETRDYTGVWDGSFKWAYTDNPAWVSYDITLNDRFGTGARINASMVDKWELYLIAQYCDQLVPDGKGGMEPRYICNVYIQTAAEAWQVLRDIASIYRGMTYWAGGQMVNIADMPRELDYTYSKSNVIDGKFTYTSNSEKSRYTRALVSYDNPENGYESDVTSVGDPKLQRRYGDRVIELSAIGCTRESEAQRRGKWAILTNNSDRTVSFAVGLDGRITPPGWVIGVADNKLSGRVIAGRIAAATLNTVTLDRDATVNPGDRLIINLPSGKAEARTVQSAAGRVISLTVNYSELPLPQLQWAIEADDLVIQQFRVIRLAKTDNTYEITGVQHNPDKYPFIDTGARLEERPISVLPIGAIPAPASVTISQSVLTEQTMAVTTMTIEWDPVENAVAYEVEWRKDNGNWIKLPRTGETSTDIKGVYTGQYLARVRAINAADIMSVPRSSALTDIVGKTGAPPALASFVTTSLVFAIRLNWAFAPGSEDTLRTEIEYASNSSGTGAIKLGDYAYPIANHTLMGLSAGANLWFRARIVDRTGNVGPFTAWTQGQASANQAEYDAYFSGIISETALAQELQEQINMIPILEAQLAELTGAPEWDFDTAYLASRIVKFDGGLYRALQDVPAETNITDTNYWEKIGDYESIGELVAALAAEVSELETSVALIDGQLQASASRLDTIIAAYRDEDDGEGQLANVLSGWKSKAAIRTERTVRANAVSALAQEVTTVSAEVQGQSAAVEQALTAVADLENGLQAMWSVKLGVTQDGKYYAAGIGLGIENTDVGLQSQFLVWADRFAIINQIAGTSTVTAPFVVQGGQTFISQAMIGNAWITNAMIGDIIQSNNYVAGSTGWRFDKNGNLEANSATFRGQLIAATGSFTGTVSVVNSGKRLRIDPSATIPFWYGNNSVPVASQTRDNGDFWFDQQGRYPAPKLTVDQQSLNLTAINTNYDHVVNVTSIKGLMDVEAIISNIALAGTAAADGQVIYLTIQLLNSSDTVIKSSLVRATAFTIFGGTPNWVISAGGLDDLSLLRGFLNHSALAYGTSVGYKLRYRLSSSGSFNITSGGVTSIWRSLEIIQV